MSFAGRRMMAAAAGRRGFQSQRIPVPKEEPNARTADSYLDVLQTLKVPRVLWNLSSLPRVLWKLDPMTRHQFTRGINHKGRFVRINANPMTGMPPDGNIWYDQSWKDNLVVVFLFSACFGLYDARAKEKRQSGNLSLSPPTS
uniref:Uncharacterized protein n=1 Tax=Leersia perrieri TaxID=77586 RepID=A0A0D9WUT2_9ORYZ